MYYVGIDLGTSAVKLVLMDEKGSVQNIVSKEYELRFPQAGWAEQDPEDWWAQTVAGLEDLLAWMSKADFFTAPASTKYHGGYAGGLCQHSIDVYQYAKRLTFLMPKAPTEESVAIAALFHDLCKVNLYKMDKRNQKINGEWQEVPYYVVDEKFHFGGHGSKSVFLIQQFMKLTTEEAAAINCHMGFSDGSPSVIRDVGNAYSQFHLAWITHIADEAATFLLDR